MTTRVSDVMDPTPLTVEPTLSVRDLAELLLARPLEGACVVEDGNLIGVATAMDLVFQSQPAHMPSFFHFLEALIPLESVAKAEQDLRKIAGATVRDVMTAEPVTTTPGEPVAAVAERMVARHLSLVPVLDGRRLVGAVTKAGILRSAYGLK